MGMTTSRRPSFDVRVLLAGWLVLQLSAPALGRISVRNSPIHHALYARHADTSVLAAVITEVEGVASPSASITWVDAVRVEVHQVPLDRGWTGGGTPRLDTSVLSWPVALVPPEAGTSVLLLVRSDWPQPGEQYVEAVLPWSGEALPGADDESEARKIVAMDLLAVLDTSTSDEQKIEILQAVAPVLPADEASRLDTFRSHPDRRVRRAVFGAQMFARPSDELAAWIADDLKFFFTAGEGSECRRAGSTGCWPLSDLFENYLYLEDRARRGGGKWSDEEARDYQRIAERIRAAVDLPPAAEALLFPAD